MVKVLIKKLDPKVKLPIYKTEGSSGMDLMAFLDKPVSIMPKKSEYFLNLLGLNSFSINNLKIDIPVGQALIKPKILFKKY